MRLEDELIDGEVRRITDMGVEIITNSPIASPNQLRSLITEKGFDAIFVGMGLQAGVDLLDVGAEHCESVVTALDFLKCANIRKQDPTSESSKLVKGKDVVVLGGGSVAMDAANTARWLGANNVYVVAREALEDFPADVQEIALARANNVIFVPQSKVVEVHRTSDRKKISGLDLKEVVGTKTGERWMTFRDRPGTESYLKADSLIVAIGQQFDEMDQELARFLGKSNHGWIVIDKNTCETLVPKVYAGGDAVRGGETVVSAIADGKAAAISISGIRDPPPRATKSLEIDFCGVKFPNPFCLSSSPVSNTAAMCASAFDKGWGGVFYKTLNLEDKFKILHPSPRLSSIGYEGNKVVAIQNMEQISDRALRDNLNDIAWLRRNYPDKVIGVSIMGYDDVDWERLARLSQEAGAHILELNFSCPQMARPDAGHRVGQSFSLIESFTRAAKRGCTIPVIAKMTPNITDMVPAALSAKKGGADAISAINTVKSISHVNIDDFYHPTPLPTIRGQSAISGLSGAAMRPIGLRFVAELCLDPQLKLPVSGMGGVYTWRDALEYLSVGASNIQVTSCVMRYGYGVVEDMIDGLQRYMKDHGVEHLSELVGRALPNIVDPSKLDTSTEAVSIIDPEKCVGCGQCVTACLDAAAQALHLEDTEAYGRIAKVDEVRCVGCLLCKHVCPVEGAVSFRTRPRIEHPI